MFWNGTGIFCDHVHWFHYEMLASGVDATKPRVHIPIEKSLGIVGLTGRMTAIRGNKDIPFPGSPFSPVCAKVEEQWRRISWWCGHLFGWIWLQNKLQIPFKHCALAVNFQVEHEQKEDLHKSASMKVHALAFVIWSGGQLRWDSWCEVCESIKYSSLYVFRAYFQTIQQAFPSTIQSGQSSNTRLIKFTTIFKLCLYWNILKYYNGSCP